MPSHDTNPPEAPPKPLVQVFPAKGVTVLFPIWATRKEAQHAINCLLLERNIDLPEWRRLTEQFSSLCADMSKLKGLLP